MGYVLLSAVLVAADRLLKGWTVRSFSAPPEGMTATLDAARPLLPGVVELTRIHNYGAAWSSFSGRRAILIALPALIVLTLLWVLRKGYVRHPLGKAACACIIAGGLGNLIDRVLTGYVVDMFHFTFWPSYPVFNIADLCIVAGAILGGVYYLRFYEKYDAPKKEKTDGTHPADGKR